MQLRRKDVKKKLAVTNQVKASSVYTICNIIQRGLALFTIPFFARIMPQEEMGVSTVYSSVMYLVIIFTSLQLPYGSFNKAMVKFEDDRDGYVSSCNCIFTVLTVGYFLIYFCFRERINNLVNLPTSLMILMGFEMLFSSAYSCWLGINRFEFKYKKIAFVTLAQAVLVCVVSVIAVWCAEESKGEVRVLASGYITVVFGLVIYIESMLKGRTFFSKEYWKYAFSFNLPLLAYYFSQMIFNQSDRLMIDKMCGRADAAKYGMAYTLGMLLTIVLNAMNNAYVPWFYKKIGENDYEANRAVTFGFSVLFAFLLLGVIAVGPEIILVMGGEGYMSAIWVIPPVAFSLLFLFFSQIFINVEFYYEEKNLLVLGSIFSAVINVVLNYYYINRFGYIASAYTTLVSYILFAVCNYFCMLYTCKKRGKNSNVIDLKRIIGLSVVFSICMSVLMVLYEHVVLRYSLIGFVLVVMFIFRKRIIKTIEQYMALYR